MSYRTTNARYASMALRHVKPESHDHALNAVALYLDQQVKAGRLTPGQLDTLPDDAIHGVLAAFAQQQPEHARPPPEKPALPTTRHRGW
jgi:hypothetical protein